MFRRPPFFGRGLAFPFRLNPATGGAQLTAGSDDPGSVTLQYVAENELVREDPVEDKSNHIGESVSHILLTHPGEHDTLPEFGSHILGMVSRPNSIESKYIFEEYMALSTERWEKRCTVPVPDGIDWQDTPREIDQGELPVILRMDFIGTQAPKNLVAPFVTPRQARVQEYPLNDPDAAGHDDPSRYYGQTIYSDESGRRFLRHATGKPITYHPDDLFEKGQLRDSWLLMAHRAYNDIRQWWRIADASIDQAAADGLPRDYLDTCGDPEPGELYRMPSVTRVLMEAAL